MNNLGLILIFNFIISPLTVNAATNGGGSGSKDGIEERTAEIVALHVSKQVWGKGVGKEILEYAVQEIEREGYEKIELWVFEKNLRARRFYSKNGFCETQEKRETVFDGEIEIKYLK